MNTDLLHSLDVSLPPGRIVLSGEGDGDAPALWVSEGPVAFDLWKRVHAQHTRTGIWPLLLEPLRTGEEDFRPWSTGELFPEGMTSPGKHDAEELLAQWWEQHSPRVEDGVLDAPARTAVTAPFGRFWPGPAPATTPSADPEAAARECAGFFTDFRDEVRLGLVAAARGADALATAGWSGPMNYDNDFGKYAAVLRSWEDRFGVRVVGVGFATLHLSVASPPVDKGQALRVAAEHFAFCPDNIWQGPDATLDAYAERLMGADCWDFWWD
ncbi:DUF4253 domain-containing protein [Streptomyces sp. NPDC001941]|uniref:DUF4253 domain-containing protein n=1 Tax=Streptomyces sp. NPDC001941 TaxID=3154659 RepID=UPI003326E9BE